MKTILIGTLITAATIFSVFGKEGEEDGKVLFSDPTTWPYEMPESSLAQFNGKKCFFNDNAYMVLRLPLGEDCKNAKEIKIVCKAATNSNPPGRVGLLIQAPEPEGAKKTYTTEMQVADLTGELTDITFVIPASALKGKVFQGSLLFYRFQSKGNLYIESVTIQPVL